MPRWLKFAIWVVCIGVVLVFAERAIFGSWERVMRYRFTMEIDDNGQIRKGTTVQELYCKFNDGILEHIGSALTCGTKGDALVVDLGEKGLLFALIAKDDERRETSGEAIGIFIEAFLQKNEDVSASSFDRVKSHTKERVNIGLDQLPLLVRFGDIKDAMTLQRLDPHHIDSSFGSGVRISKAYVELTQDPVTKGIGKLLLWNQGSQPWLIYKKGDIYATDLRPDRIRIQISDFTNANGE